MTHDELELRVAEELSRTQVDSDAITVSAYDRVVALAWHGGQRPAEAGSREGGPADARRHPGRHDLTCASCRASRHSSTLFPCQVTDLRFGASRAAS